MKRQLFCMLVAVMLFLPACGGSEPQVASTPLTFDVGFRINTHGYLEEEYGTYTSLLMRSRAVLDAYYNGDMDGNKSAYLPALAKYDDAFFADKALLLITRTENSGSNVLTVQGVSLRPDRLEVQVQRTLPHVRTDDMARWVIGVELAKDGLPEGIAPRGDFPVTVEFITDEKGTTV